MDCEGVEKTFQLEQQQQSNFNGEEGSLLGSRACSFLFSPRSRRGDFLTNSRAALAIYFTKVLYT